LPRAIVRLALLLSLGCAGDAHTWGMYQAAGEAAGRSARYEKAEGLLQQALLRSETGAERARTLRALARVARERGELAAARARLDPLRAEAAVRPPADAREHVELELEEGWLLLAEGRTADAARVFERAEEEARRSLGEADTAAGWAAAGRGEALRRSGDRAAALAALERALEVHRSVVQTEALRPGEPVGVLVELTSLGALQREEGHLGDAQAALRAAVKGGGQELGLDHPRVADALAELAQVELALGDDRAALRAAARAAEITRRLPPDHPSRVAAEASLARCEGR
jgi:tetratricopeptide (TPR) repeat protein